MSDRWQYRDVAVWGVFDEDFVSIAFARAAERDLAKAERESAMAAALFAWHPLHVQSVAWVAERKDVLSGFFWMLTLLAYCRYVEKLTARRYAAVLICFVLALLSKPMVVTLPCVLLLLDVWPLKRIQPEAVERIADPNTAPTDPATYHLYAVTRWSGTPAIRDTEHAELGWFPLAMAARLPDLALEAYRPVFTRLAARA